MIYMSYRSVLNIHYTKLSSVFAAIVIKQTSIKLIKKLHVIEEDCGNKSKQQTL